jgi:hypothetical protein
MHKIYFSVKQANELIKKIRPEVERIVALNEELSLLDNTKIEFDEENIENFLLEVELNKSFHEKNVELYALLGDLIRQGCIVRDLEKMEIDFYSKLDAKEIILCWKPNEDSIKHWHEVGAELEERKPIRLVEEAYFEQLKKMK